MDPQGARRHKIRIVERIETTLGRHDILDDAALGSLSDEALEAQTEALLEQLLTEMIKISEEDGMTLEVRAAPASSRILCAAVRAHKGEPTSGP